jgi:hypothetical protein
MGYVALRSHWLIFAAAAGAETIALGLQGQHISSVRRTPAGRRDLTEFDQGIWGHHIRQPAQRGSFTRKPFHAAGLDGLQSYGMWRITNSNASECSANEQHRVTCTRYNSAGQAGSVTVVVWDKKTLDFKDHWGW